MPEISLASIRRIIKKAGADRISQEAVEYLREIAEKYIFNIAKTAVELAEHAKRKTLLKEDILRAIRIREGKFE